MTRRGCLILLFAAAFSAASHAEDAVRADLEARFGRTLQPFIEKYCLECHGKDDPEAELDLTTFPTMAALVRDGQRWSQLLERLEH